MLTSALLWAAAILGWVVAFIFWRQRLGRALRWASLAIGLLLTVGAFVLSKPAPAAPNGPPDPIEFAHSTYVRLSQGDPTVDDAIDFANLNAGGLFIGGTYGLIPDDAQKEAYRKQFIANYAKMFQQTGFRIEILTNWRLDSADASRETVAADIPGGKTALVVVTRTNPPKVVEFNMR